MFWEVIARTDSQPDSLELPHIDLERTSLLRAESAWPISPCDLLRVRSHVVRFPLEIVRRTRARLGMEFPIIFRISAIDLVEGGLTGEEIDLYAKNLEQAGVDLLDVGVGWHESIVPTIATSVPRAAFAFAARRLKQVVTIPVVASNRINMPAVAENLLEKGDADMVSMARPFLADPEFVIKAQSGRTDEINPCIGYNQACLDHIFTDRLATCLVNPRACHETDLNIEPASIRRKIAVAGSGPAGLACAATAAERGHAVSLEHSSRCAAVPRQP